jgi:hypothetical protein
MQSSIDLQPVSTIFPDVKSNTVHTGCPRRMVMAANFCFSNLAFGIRWLMLRRSSLCRCETLRQVPTRLCTCATSTVCAADELMYSSSAKMFLVTEKHCLLVAVPFFRYLHFMRALVFETSKADIV